MEDEQIPAGTWRMINNLVAELYRTPGFPDLDMVVGRLRDIVPFSHSMTCLIGSRDERVEFFEYHSADIPEEIGRAHGLNSSH